MAVQPVDFGGTLKDCKICKRLHLRSLPGEGEEKA